MYLPRPLRAIGPVALISSAFFAAPSTRAACRDGSPVQFAITIDEARVLAEIEGFL
jgi:hypothetical protein